MAVEVKMGRDGLMPFQAYVGGWIQGKRHDGKSFDWLASDWFLWMRVCPKVLKPHPPGLVRQIRLFLDAVHKNPSFDIWGGSKVLQSSTGD